jgi:hypothetical protein
MSIAQVFSREWKRLPPQPGTGKGALAGNVLALLFVAAIVPLLINRMLLDAFVLIPFAMLSIFFIAVLIPGSFAAAGGRSDVAELAGYGVSVKSVILGKAGAIVLYSWFGGMLQLAVSLGALNLLSGGGGMLLPSAAALIDAALVTLAGGILVAVVGVLLATESRSVGDAKSATKSAFILLLFGMVDVYFVLPKAWKAQMVEPGSGALQIACGILAAVFVLAALLILPFAAAKLEVQDKSEYATPLTCPQR